MLSRTTTKGGQERNRRRGCSRAHWSGNNQAALIETNSEVKSSKKGCDKGKMVPKKQLSLTNSSDYAVKYKELRLWKWPVADRVGRQINKAYSVNKPTVRKIELITEEGKLLNRGHFPTACFALENAMCSCYNKMTSVPNIDEPSVYLCGISPYEGIEQRAVFLKI